MDKKELRTLVEAVATELNRGDAPLMSWEIARYDPARYCECITRDDGAKLWFDTRFGCAKPGQIAIRGELPAQTTDGKRTRYADNPKIGVSVAKSPAQIASDIKRRLLPEYTDALLKAQKHLAECNREIDGKTALAARMTKLFGGSAVIGGNGSIYPAEGLMRYGRIEVQGSNTVHLDASLTAAQAEVVARALRELAERIENSAV